MSKNRLEAFSDGVIAIVMTLLVLELKVPALAYDDVSTRLFPELVRLAPRLLSYGISFLIAAVWWVAHHQFFASLRKTDRKLLWLNMLWLLWLSFIPFPTALLGMYPTDRVAVGFYATIGLLTACSFSWMRWHASFHGNLMRAELSPEMLRSAMRRSLLCPVLYAVAVLASACSAYAGLAIIIVLPVYFFLPGEIDRHLAQQH